MNLHRPISIEQSTKTRLSIDKLSLTYSIPDRSKVSNLAGNFERVCTDGRFKGVTVKAARRHQYQVSVPILFGGSYLNDRLFLDLVARHSGISDLRLDFNPEKVGPEGIEYICSFLQSITEENPLDIFRSGTSTRIDLALDISGLSSEDVIVRSKGQRKHGVYSDQRGKLQSTYLGTPRSNRTVAYDKSTPSGKVLRIERRIKPLCRGHELTTLPDPFQKVQLIPVGSLRPHLDGLVPGHFFDSIRVRGVRHVLSTLPPSQRRQLLAVINDPTRSGLPPTSVIWADWPALLRSSGLPIFDDDTGP